MTRRIANVAINLSLALLTCLAVLGGFEVALRVFLPQKLYRFPRTLFRNDPDLVFGLTPGFQGAVRTPEYSTHVRVNSLGLRGPEVVPKSPGTLRVLGLGDSFVSAFNVEENDTFLATAQKWLQGVTAGGRVEIVNAGTPNYGTWHELRLLHRLIPTVHPDAVILCVYVGNDVQNNLAPRETAVRNGYLVARNEVSGILPYPLRSWLQQNSMAYVFLWYGWNELRPLAGLGHVDPLRDFKALVSVKTAPYLETGYRISGDLLREIRDELDSHQIALLVALIPAELQVYPGHFEALVRRQRLDSAAFNLELPEERWARLAQGLGIPVVDLLPTFRSHVSGPGLYMHLDGHLTREGNRLAGEAIGRTLLAVLGSLKAGSR